MLLLLINEFSWSILGNCLQGNKKFVIWNNFPDVRCIDLAKLQATVHVIREVFSPRTAAYLLCGVPVLVVSRLSTTCQRQRQNMFRYVIIVGRLRDHLSTGIMHNVLHEVVA